MQLIATDMIASKSTRLTGLELQQTAQLMRPRKFWANTMVNKTWEHMSESELNQPIKILTKEEVSLEPVALPDGLRWEEMDLQDQAQLTEFAEFLAQNYIQDSKNQFRLQYPIEFLKWALFGPSWHKEWHLCIREGPRLVGTLTCTPVTLFVNRRKLEPHCIANFLCVTSDFRDKDLPTLLN